MFSENIDRQNQPFFIKLCLSPGIIIFFQISSNDMWQSIQASLQLTGL